MRLKLIVILCISSLSDFVTSSKGDHVRNNNSFFEKNDYQFYFEHMDVVRFNKRYAKEHKIVNFKYNRTTAAINMTWTFAVNLVKHLNAVVQAYRFASNEYRLFPIHFQLDLCEAFESNIIGFGSLGRCGNFTGCPFLMNTEVRMCNWAPDPTQFPPFIPDGKYMVEMQVRFQDVEVILDRAYGTVFRSIL